MNQLRSRLLLSVSTLFLLVAEAGAVVIDFDEVTPQNTFGLISVTSQGYDISTNGTICAGPGEQFSQVDANGIYIENVVTEPALCQVGIFLERSDNGIFALNSFDLFGMSASNASFSGTLAGGGSANLSTPVGTGDWLTLESFQVSTNGCAMCMVGIGMDTINVTAVPVPAAVWMFGSGLLGLGALSRRHQRF